MNKFLQKALLATVATVSLSAAVDAEFAAMSQLQAKQRGSHYKALAAAGAAQPHHAPLTAGGGTDVDASLRTMVAGQRDAAFDGILAVAKPIYIAALDGVIDGLLAADGAFLVPAIVNVGGAHQPADRSRNAFKAALAAKINALDHTLAGLAPLAGVTIRDMANFKDTIDASVQAAIDTWVKTILPGADAAFTVAAAGGMNRDAFIGALNAVVAY